MSKRTEVKKALEANNQLDADSLLALAEEADRYHAIKALVDTDGGRELRNVLSLHIIHRINRLTSNYATMSHIELVATCADISAALTQLRLLTNAKQSFEVLAQEIKDTLGS